MVLNLDFSLTTDCSSVKRGKKGAERILSLSVSVSVRVGVGVTSFGSNIGVIAFMRRSRLFLRFFGEDMVKDVILEGIQQCSSACSRCTGDELIFHFPELISTLQEQQHVLVVNNSLTKALHQIRNKCLEYTHEYTYMYLMSQTGSP